MVGINSQRKSLAKKSSRNDYLKKRSRFVSRIFIPIVMAFVFAVNWFVFNSHDYGALGIHNVGETNNGSSNSNDVIVDVPSKEEKDSSNSWCNAVKEARSSLTLSNMHIKYPCLGMKPATSAIVCMLTDGTTEERASRIIFTAKDYIHGAMSLGASLQDKIDPSETHQLLLLREGFELEKEDLIRLQSVGWTIGKAPDFPLEKKYIPKFPRYKTTYTKVTAIGLSEYKCVMLMDADTLAVGDLRDIMKCDTVFQHPNNRVAGTIDWYRMHWELFNTGSILWKTDAKEMERVYKLTTDPSFMKRFGSDQDFLNNVYNERLKDNIPLNNAIVALDTPESRALDSGNDKNSLSPVIPHESAKEGAVVPLSWDYNAQTHAEVQNKEFWISHRPTTRILHYTEKKGWQCEKTLDDPPPFEDMPKNCKGKNRPPLCFCREAHLYWKALEQAEAASKLALEALGASAATA